MKLFAWTAVPLALLATLVVLMMIRIRMVQARATLWTGDGCPAGPYNPAEHTYLWAITAVTTLLILTTTVLAVLAASQIQRVLMVVILIPALLFASGYLFFVWTGGEENNQPHPRSHCTGLVRHVN
ncbi:hypothetical protein [Mycolicibacterium llatzerense]|uniref:hypothetical protein n=1 Tax=Mycolicibacterium llatzerense TaxID=280871 RepID=UPI0005BAEEB9|nr:hypothetical protein [Mycolicibacterium llatzerense]MCT7372383.1 hypothetical protein [Mycolicibacterium llatzerense]